MRVAIIHYWLVSMRGGEKVIEALCHLFPEADIFTHVYDPTAISETIRKHKITTTFINDLPNAKKLYKNYLSLMPIALEQINLRGYDLVISSESGPAKGIIPPESSFHICYCHSPMRYIWNMYHEYQENAGLLKRVLMPPLTNYLRTWDAVAAMRVDRFVANSGTVAARIQKYYRRESVVIHPPVDVDIFKSIPEQETEDYYLMVGELVGYKKPDVAVAAFNAMRRRLVVIGGGEMLPRLRKLAGPTVTILGPQPIDALKRYYSRCRALVFPGEEDFGIVPVEAMASGRPVVAFGRGGATETVVEGVTGLFFEEQTAEGIRGAIQEFERLKFDPDAIRAHSQQFNPDRFASQIAQVIRDAMGHKAVAQVGNTVSC